VDVCTLTPLHPVLDRGIGSAGKRTLNGILRSGCATSGSTCSTGLTRVKKRMFPTISATSAGRGLGCSVRWRRSPKKKNGSAIPPPWSARDLILSLVCQIERGITPPRIRCVALLEMANADEIAGPSWYANQEPTSQEHTQRHVRFMSTPKTRCTTLLRRRSSTLTTGCRPGGWGAPESARSVALARDARRACLI
jgi:hypothetical protein